MDYLGNKPRTSLWEYGYYIVVTIGLLSIGIVLLGLFSLIALVIRMKKKTVFVLLLLLVVVVAVAGYGFWAYTHPVDIGKRVVTVIIKPGDTFASIADTLLAERVVTSRTCLSIPARLMHIDKKLTPGRYDFTGQNSCKTVLDKLRDADFVRVKITIPEGLPIWKIASIVSKQLALDSAVFVNYSNDTAFLAKLNLPCLEGFLYPETYVFPWGTSERDVIKALVWQFYRVTDSLWPDTIGDGLNWFDIVKLASIIEAETQVDAERVLVASVYRNRLRKRMKLDADPTVIYGLGGLDRPLYKKDLRKDTPYNTYLHKGLPPTPINSPGVKAIWAALHPAKTDYYYFVADKKGGHIFSRTNAEHNRAIRKIRSAG